MRGARRPGRVDACLGENHIDIGGTAWDHFGRAVGGAEIADNVELKLSDRLAVERTVLAADRSMLAGVRTSLNFIAFGFAIYQVLRYLQEQSSVAFMRPQTPRNFGMFMLLAGTAPLVVMMFQYRRTLKRIGTNSNVLGNPYFLMALAAALLGTVLLATFTVSFLLR
jgi:putative membrane protein